MMSMPDTMPANMNSTMLTIRPTEPRLPALFAVVAGRSPITAPYRVSCI